jgi:A/G-specific adenine glycosylase
MKKTIGPKTAVALTDQLLTWYELNKRVLPWRNTRDPYHIWVSEIMLQQTQVDTVVPYYHRFLKKYPTIDSLARSELQDVLKMWENLGYYSRVRHMHETAKMIALELDGKIPDTWDAIIRLPGIGPYTAGAILSIAYGKPIPAIDGNARRVFCRLFAIEDPAYSSGAQQDLYRLVAGIIPRHSPAAFNQAVMDLGSLVCTPKNPACPVCPMQNRCLAFKHALQERLPVMKKKAPLPHRHAIAAILRDSRNRVLIVRRPSEGLLASLWKFPGGFLHSGESPQDGLRKTILEELGWNIEGGGLIASVRHAYTHFRMTLHIFLCGHPGTEPLTPSYQQWQWATPNDLSNLPFSRADRKVIAAISHLNALSFPPSELSKAGP